MSEKSILHDLVAAAVRTGAEAIEVEYKDGCEEVVAMRGPIGFGTGRDPARLARVEDRHLKAAVPLDFPVTDVVAWTS